MLNDVTVSTLHRDFPRDLEFTSSHSNHLLMSRHLFLDSFDHRNSNHELFIQLAGTLACQIHNMYKIVIILCTVDEA